MALKVVDHQVLCNDTELVVGEIVLVMAPASAITIDGYLDIERLDAVAVSGLDSYHTGKRLDRLSYAKTDEPVRSLLCEKPQSE